MQQQGGLSEHLQRHHTWMVGDTFDGVVDKEGVIGGGECALRGQTLAFLERHHFVNEREACGVGHRRRHLTRKFERCFSEGGEAVHQAQRTATKDTTLATSQRFVDENGHPVFDRQGLNTGCGEHRLDGATSGHADVSPTGPTDGDAPAIVRRCEASHFGVEDRVGRCVIGLPTVAKSAGDAGEATSKGRSITAGSLDRRQEGLPTVDFHTDHAVKHIVSLVGHQFGILETGSVDNTRDRASEVAAKRFKRRTVHDVHRMVMGVVSCFLNGLEREVHVSTSGEPLPSPVPFHHGHFAVLTRINEALAQGVLFLGQLLFGPVNPRSRGFDQLGAPEQLKVRACTIAGSGNPNH